MLWWGWRPLGLGGMAVRVLVTLACEECKRRNYATSKNRKDNSRLQLRKYCPFCRRHTVHRETR